MSAPAARDDDDDGFSIDKRIQTASVKTIDYLLKVTNFINAALLLLAAILALIQKSFAIILLMTAIYVGCFACCLLTFELHIKQYERFVYENFGFMFSFNGRAAFFIFIGTLSIGFNSPAGYVAVAYTALNMLWNYYCMRLHPEYSAYMKADNEMRRSRAREGVNRRVAKEQAKTSAKAAPPGAPPGAGTGASVAIDMTPESAFEAGNQVQKPAAAKPAPVNREEWEKLYDENTKLYYFHNHVTGETRWEEP